MTTPSSPRPSNEEGLPEYWVLSFSGGKDSTALGLEWLKRHQQNPGTYPFHEVIYCDTGMEFPGMMDHINRLERIFTETQSINWKSALLLRKNGWLLAFRSTEHVNSWQHFGNGLKKLVSRKLQSQLRMESAKKSRAGSETPSAAR